jgi:hypothetical protein
MSKNLISLFLVLGLTACIQTRNTQLSTGQNYRQTCESICHEEQSVLVEFSVEYRDVFVSSALTCVCTPESEQGEE